MTDPGGRESPRDAHGQPEEGRSSPLWILAVALRERRLVAACVGVGVGVALVLALMRAKKYTTGFSFVPQATQDATTAGLASLAGQFGVSLGAGGGVAQSPQLYADLLRTREVLVPIAKDSFVVSPSGGGRQPLATFLRIRGADEGVVLAKTLRALRTRIIFPTVARATGVVSVSVRTRSPQVSLEVANRLLLGVNAFNLVTRQSQAGEERRFTEGRLADARTALRAAEDALERFLLTNRQVGNSPGLAFERDRLQREVTLRQEVVTGLVQHYEDARIREVRDTPVITVLERPVLAAEADLRGRVLVVLGGILIGLFVGVAAALLRDGIRRQRDAGTDPAFNLLMREWRRLRGAPQ